MFTITKVIPLFALVALIINHVNAHTHLSNLDVAGNKGPDGEYIRQVVPKGKRNFFVDDVTSQDLMCRPSTTNWDDTKTLSLDLSKKFAVEWHHSDSSSSDDVISESHHGPCLVYMALRKDVESKKDKPWFKIYEQGNKGKDKWCTDYLRGNHGKLDIIIPKDIPNGEYLLRTEIIALHGAKKKGGAQFYPNCAQLAISGATGKFNGKGPEYVAIPGVYHADDPGILINIYKGEGLNYKIPGPPVYRSGTSKKKPCSQFAR